MHSIDSNLQHLDQKKFDRKSNFHVVRNFRFPIPGDPSFQKCLKNTIIDGEFVLDKEEDGTVSLFYHRSCKTVKKIDSSRHNCDSYYLIVYALKAMYYFLEAL